VAGPSRVTFMRCLKPVIERDYRTRIAQACFAQVTQPGGLALVLYDLTTLPFETDVEDGLRKVGMSKECRVDPQITSPMGPDSRSMCICSKATRPRPRPWSRS
jgi:hypothetical protein